VLLNIPGHSIKREGYLQAFPETHALYPCTVHVTTFHSLHNPRSGRSSYCTLSTLVKCVLPDFAYLIGLYVHLQQE